MIIIKGATKAGRARIAQILDSATRITRTEINNITDERIEARDVPVDLMRGWLDIDGKSAVLFEVDARTFVYLPGSASGHRVTRCTITTEA